jgi:Peptidase family M23
MPRRTMLALTLLVATTTPGRTTGLDHFLLYRVRPGVGAPAFEPFGPVTLSDDVASRHYLISRPRQLGVPADKNGEGVPDPTIAVLEYPIAATRGTPRLAKRSQVPVLDQCSDVSVALNQPTSLLVPATIDPRSPATQPDPGAHDLDHFLCYKAAAETRRPDGTTVPRLPRGTQVDVADQFGTRRYDLLAITKVCRPVDKDVDPANPPVVLSGPDAGQAKPIEPAPIRDADRYLVCYRAMLSTSYIRQHGCGPADPNDRGTPIVPPQPPPPVQEGLFTADQLASLQLATVGPTELCLPPAPRDSDQDGVPDASDPCPQTTPGTAQVVPGCSALDVVQNIDNLLVPLRKNAGALAGQIDEDPDLATALQEIQDAMPNVDGAAGDTRAGDPCSASTRFGMGQTHLASAARLIGDARAQAESAAMMSMPDASEGDVTPEQLRVMDLDAVLGWANGLVRDAQVVGDAVGSLCAGGVPVHTRGVVQQIQSAERRVELDDGRIFGLAETLSSTGPVWEGRPVTVTGLSFSFEGGIATDMSPDGPVASIPPVTLSECLQLRVAPIQRFAPVSNGPYTLHFPDAYDDAGTLHLEQGMGLAAVDLCKSQPSPSRTFARYSLRIEATPVGGSAQTLALALAAGTHPVSLESLAGDATLTVHHQAQTCRPGLQIQCDDPTDTSVETFAITVHPSGTRCVASYSGTNFDVNDQIPSDFRTVQLQNFKVLAANDPNTSPVFEAEGYPVTQGSSSYPTVQPVVGSQPFAILNTDFFPIDYQPVPGVFDFTPLFGALGSGIDHAAGLRWPHARGKNHGHDWQYSCTLPVIVRDVVDFCAGGTDAFYRFPWAPDDTNWGAGQGSLPNCPDSQANPQNVCCSTSTSCCTHAFGYAYDLPAPCLSSIRAARGGRVISLDESQTQNSANPCPVAGNACGTTTTCAANAGANVLWVQHQDGSFVRYLHMNQNQIIPAVGDYVRRGELVAYVGMTGFTTGPHLHFGPKTKLVPSGSTNQALFEGIDPGNNNALLTCYEPKGNGPTGTCYGITTKPLRSNNKKQ